MPFRDLLTPLSSFFGLPTRSGRHDGDHFFSKVVPQPRSLITYSTSFPHRSITVFFPPSRVSQTACAGVFPPFSPQEEMLKSLAPLLPPSLRRAELGFFSSWQVTLTFNGRFSRFPPSYTERLFQSLIDHALACSIDSPPLSPKENFFFFLTNFPPLSLIVRGFRHLTSHNPLPVLSTAFTASG